MQLYYGLVSFPSLLGMRLLVAYGYRGRPLLQYSWQCRERAESHESGALKDQTASCLTWLVLLLVFCRMLSER